MVWDWNPYAADLKINLDRLRSCLSAHVYEDVHEILVTQLLRISSLIAGQTERVSIHHCDQLIDQLHRLFRAANTAHTHALTIVQEAPVPGYSYCLFLRQFDTGEHSIVLPPIESDDVLPFGAMYLKTDYNVQKMLLESLSDDWRVVGVQNLRILLDESWRERRLLHTPLPMLFLAVEDWKRCVGWLIEDANAVIAYVDQLTPGVAWEINEISRRKCSAKTLILATDAVNEDVLVSSGQIVRCPGTGLGVDLGSAATAVTEFLSRKTTKQPSRRRISASSFNMPFDFSAAIPIDVLAWVRSNIGRMEAMLNVAFRNKSDTAVSLAAAAAQSLTVYGWLAWAAPAIAKGLSVFAGIQSLPGIRNQRSRHGQTRAELADANIARAMEYSTSDQCEYWRTYTFRAFAE